MKLTNYSTTIGVGQTVGEIQDLLIGHGASAVGIKAGKDRVPSAVSFQLEHPILGLQNFTLPVDVDAMHVALVHAYDQGEAKGISASKAEDRGHAAKVAWRCVKDWLSAQLTLVSAGQAQFDQVMLPYMHTPDGQTLFEAYVEHGTKAIEGASR